MVPLNLGRLPEGADPAPRAAFVPHAAAGLLVAAVLGACNARGSGPEAAALATDGVPWEVRSGTWRDDPAWHDGRAEVARYRATRTIYDEPREYVATAYTNVEHVDPRSTVKVLDGDGVAMFKHHFSERIPTENYDYDFSTSVYVTREGLLPFKLAAASQEDCGASFKQVWREGNRLHVWESVYLPGAGTFGGTLDGTDIQFEDALTLVLRDAPEAAPGGGWNVRAIASQRHNGRVPTAPREFRVRPAGEESLELPVGTVQARRIELLDPGGAVRATYWFASEHAAPWLGVLVRYEGPRGQTLRLESLERDAYWERP